MKKDREKGQREGKKEKRGKKNQWKTKRTGDYRTIINLMTLLWRSTPEIFWAELFKCLQHKRVGGYTRLPPLLLPPPTPPRPLHPHTRACRLYEFYRDLSSVKYAVPISFVFANELSDRRIANARKLAGKFDSLDSLPLPLSLTRALDI